MKEQVELTLAAMFLGRWAVVPITEIRGATEGGAHLGQEGDDIICFGQRSTSGIWGLEMPMTIGGWWWYCHN